MRKRIAVLAVFFTAAMVRAQCVSTVQPISQPFSFPNHAAGPIATDGTILGLAKNDTSTSSPAIFFAEFDANLNQITAERSITASSINGATHLFWADSEFGLFYQRTDATAMLQRIDRAGNPNGSPIPMPHTWSFNDEFDVTWNHALSTYAVVHSVTFGLDRGLWLSLISREGNVLTDVAITSFEAYPAQPRVAAFANGTVGVVWARSGPSPATFMTLVSGTALNESDVTERQVIRPRMASDGNSILFIFTSPKTGGGTELRYVIVNAAGTIKTADSSLMSGSGSDIAASSLIWNPTLAEWALVYIDATIGLNVFADTRLRRFASIGSSSQSDTLLSPDPLHSRLSAPFPIVFLANGYVASIQQIGPDAQGSESYLVRLCPFVATAKADHPTWRPFAPVTFTATGSGGTPGYAFQWQFGDNESATGTVVQHSYNVLGTYTVTLTGTDAAGAKSVTKITVTITTIGRQRTVHH